MELGIGEIGNITDMSEAQRVLKEQQSGINDALGKLSQVIEEMRQPKEIVYDDEGEIVGVRNSGTGEITPLRRDENGNPLGL